MPEHQIIPAVPLEIVGTFRHGIQAVEHRSLHGPVLQVGRGHVHQAAARPLAFRLLGRDEKVEHALGIYRNLRVAEVALTEARRRGKEGIGLLLRIVQGIGTRGIAQALADITIIQQARGVEGIKQAVVEYHGARADGLLPFLVDTDGNGMVLPMHQVLRRADTPLMTAQAAQRAVVPLVEEPIEIVRAIVGKRDAVAHEVRPAHGGEVLHRVGLFLRVIARSGLHF